MARDPGTGTRTSKKRKEAARKRAGVSTPRPADTGLDKATVARVQARPPVVGEPVRGKVDARAAYEKIQQAATQSRYQDVVRGAQQKMAADDYLGRISGPAKPQWARTGEAYAGHGLGLAAGVGAFIPSPLQAPSAAIYGLYSMQPENRKAFTEAKEAMDNAETPREKLEATLNFALITGAGVGSLTGPVSPAGKGPKKRPKVKVHEVDVTEDDLALNPGIQQYGREDVDRVAGLYNSKTGDVLYQGPGSTMGPWHNDLQGAYERTTGNKFLAGGEGAGDVVSFRVYDREYTLRGPEGEVTGTHENPVIRIDTMDAGIIPQELVDHLRQRYPGLQIMGANERGRLTTAQLRADARRAGKKVGPSKPALPKEDRAPSRPSQALFGPGPEGFPIPETAPPLTRNDQYMTDWRPPEPKPETAHNRLWGTSDVLPGGIMGRASQRYEELLNDIDTGRIDNTQHLDERIRELNTTVSQRMEIYQRFNERLRGEYQDNAADLASDLREPGMITRSQLERRMEDINMLPEDKEIFRDRWDELHPTGSMTPSEAARDQLRMGRQEAIQAIRYEIEAGLTRSQLERKMDELNLSSDERRNLIYTFDAWEAARRNQRGARPFDQEDPTERANQVRGFQDAMGGRGPSEPPEPPYTVDEPLPPPRPTDGPRNPIQNLPYDTPPPAGAAAAGGGPPPPPEPPPTKYGFDDDFGDEPDWNELDAYYAEKDGGFTKAMKKANHRVLEALNVPRTLKSAYDISFPLRQAIVMMAAHPRLWLKVWPQMRKALFSKEEAERIQRVVEDHPQYDLSSRAGVGYTKKEGTFDIQEEGFHGYETVKKVPGVDASARAYNTFANVARLLMWQELIRLAKIEGIDVSGTSKASMDELRAIAKWVNAATGRGNIRGSGDLHALANALLFSPRLLASRLQLLNPVGYVKATGKGTWGSKFAQKRARKAMRNLIIETSVVGAIASQALGADIELDPRSADFLKLKWGDTRVDITGGLAPYMVLYARLATLQTKNQHGQIVDYGPGLNQRSAYEALLDFGENKTSPVTAGTIDWFKGERGMGDPLTLKGMIYDMFAPIGVSTAAETVVEDVNFNPPSVNLKDDPSLGLAGGTLAGNAVGLGVDTYKVESDPRLSDEEQFEASLKKAVAEELPLAKQRGWDRVPPHIVRALTLEQRVEKRLDILRAELKDQKNTNVPKGERVELKPRQEYAAVIQALRDFEPRFNYRGARARGERLSDRGLEREANRLRRVFYSRTLERWHGTG